MKRAELAPAGAPVSGITSLRGRKEALFVRIAVNLPGVLVSVPAGRTLPGRIANISVGGMYFRTEDAVAVGTEVYCIRVDGDGAEGEEVFAAGRVVHRNERGFGIAFEKLTATAFNAISAMIAESGCCLLRALPEPAEAARGPRRTVSRTRAAVRERGRPAARRAA